MATGDDAIAAGMDVVDPATDLVKDGADAINETRDYIAQRTSAVAPVAKGGTGATNATAARSNLGAAATSHLHLIDQVYAMDGVTPYATALQASLDAMTANTNARLHKAGDTMTGHLWVPLARSTPVNTSFVAAYLNGDGRLGANPSALKYKHDIEDYDGSVLGLRAVTYVLNDDPLGTVRLGVVADEANEVEPLLVVHEDGAIESFKYELLAVALLREVQRLAARVDELEADAA